MFRSMVLVVVVAAAVAAEPQRPIQVETGTYVVKVESSQFRVNVGKAGLFSAFGHDHVVEVRRYSGEIRFDARAIETSTITMEVDATSLTVLDPDVKTDERAKVQAQMEAEALEISKFPTIRFVSKKVSLDPAPGGFLGSVEGDLTLHGVTRTVKIPVEIFGAMSKLGARGGFKLKGSDYGVKQVTAAGGAVKTKDELELTFDFTCERKP